MAKKEGMFERFHRTQSQKLAETQRNSDRQGNMAAKGVFKRVENARKNSGEQLNVRHTSTENARRTFLPDKSK